MTEKELNEIKCYFPNLKISTARGQKHNLPGQKAYCLLNAIRSPDYHSTNTRQAYKDNSSYYNQTSC